MTSTERETRVLDAVVSLVDTLLDDFDVVDLLTELTERCARLLDVASAGLLLAGPRSQLHLMSATSQQTQYLELFQLQNDEGPCLDCYHTGQAVSVADLREFTTRWPRFVAAAADTGFSSVHAVPLRAAGTVLGALGLFGTTIGALNPADLIVAQTLAHVATVALVQEHAPTVETVMPRLRTTLTSHIVVEQAKGFLAERLSVSTQEALGRLRRHAQTHNRHLTEVARRLVSGDDTRAEMLADMMDTDMTDMAPSRPRPAQQAGPPASGNAW